MIEAYLADSWVRVFRYRGNQAVAHIEPLWPETFDLCIKACEAARDSALAGPEAAFVVVHRGFIPITEEEGNPYG